MSVITKGLSPAAYGAGAIMTKGFSAGRMILPDLFPSLVRASATGEPDIVRAYEPITPPDEMKLLVIFVIVWRVIQHLLWRKHG